MYQINTEQFHRDPKPTDCDFMRAPLGDKGCRYKKMVTAYNAAGEPIGGDNAPKYSTNESNHAIVSFDDGKTWRLLAGSRLDSKVNRVDVYWIKTTE